MNRSLFCIFFFFVACDMDDGSVTQPLSPAEENFDPSAATLLKQGMLTGVNHSASGTASLYDLAGTYVVVLDPYSSQNGPDLKVYLSKDARASEFIRVGNLKSTMGKQSYTVPGSPSIMDYSFVHVWCEKYSVEFARAELK